MTYLSTAQKSLQLLYDIKFVHSCKVQQVLVEGNVLQCLTLALSAIISQPKQYSALISAMRTCLTHIESIIETHSPAAKPKPGVVSEERPTSTTSTTISKAPPPPLPPKPSRIHNNKPNVPPKPSRTALSRPSSPTKEQVSSVSELPSIQGTINLTV